eukprot:scaffold49424_cov61-Phaeocystis_antarctica.AAC.5
MSSWSRPPPPPAAARAPRRAMCRSRACERSFRALNYHTTPLFQLRLVLAPRLLVVPSQHREVHRASVLPAATVAAEKGAAGRICRGRRVPASGAESVAR